MENFDPYQMLMMLQTNQQGLMTSHTQLLGLIKQQQEQIDLLLEMQRSNTVQIRLLENLHNDRKI